MQLTVEEQSSELQKIILYLNDAGYLSTAGSKKGEHDANGIVKGHAYSLMWAGVVQGTCFVHLRNPWGRSEWQGPWSDTSPLWDERPEVRTELSHLGLTTHGEIGDGKLHDDGAFFMEWGDFCSIFTTVYYAGPRQTALGKRPDGFSMESEKKKTVVQRQYWSILETAREAEVALTSHAAGKMSDKYFEVTL